MRQYHPLTSVTAITVLFAILLSCSLATSARHVTFKTPLWTFDENPAPVVENPTIELDSKLTNNMKLVFVVGKGVGNPETLQAILLQETNGGRSEMIGNKASPVGKRSYGLMQVQVIAARSVFERYPDVVESYFPNRKYSSVADEEIIALLLTDNEANVRIAAYHFKIYLSLTNGNWDKAVAAYNAGIGTVHNMSNYAEFNYVKGVKTKLNTVVRPFNNQNGLQLTQRF